MIHPLKVTTTLADETRFQIYEYMLKHKKLFTVQAIADVFQIHPNVARLHLTKLTDIGVITAKFEKTGKGGRPGRVYCATSEGVKISFPKRDDTLLIKMLLPLIEGFGEEGKIRGKTLAYDIGQQDMTRQLQLHKPLLSFDEKCEILTFQSVLIGYIPAVTEVDNKKLVQFTIYNCPFQEQITAHHQLICLLHRAYLQGQIDTLFGQNELIQTENMMHQCENCQYEIRI